MKISFVILNYNRGVELIKTLRCTKDLMVNQNDYEIIIVDNCSTDNSLELIKNSFPNETVIARSVNNGVAGWNDGFNLARGKYIVVLDDDSNIVGGLNEAISYLNDNKDVGILALNIIGGAFQTNNHKEWFDKKQCLTFIGCGAIIRNELVNKIGGFSEWLFIYAHEHDYAIRCYNAGYKIHFFSNCQVEHRTSSINRTNQRLTVYTVRNEMCIVYKYFNEHKWQFIRRILFNRLKTIKDSNLITGYYVYKGFIEFLKFKNKLILTPVTQVVQKYYAENFWSIRPVLKRSKI